MTPKVPDTFREALASIQDKDFLTTRKYREQHWGPPHRKTDRNGVDPQILFFERVLQRRMRNLNVPVFGTELMRTQQRQLMLWTEGHSKVKEYGPHTRGAAVDIIHSLKGWEIDRKAWALIGHVGKEIIAQEGLGIRWGGDWTFYDPAHWELTNWKDHPPF